MFVNFSSNNMGKIKASAGTTADIKAGVQISEVHGGYFSNEKNAEAFCKIGIKPIISKLPTKIKLVDMGGGDGLLTKYVEKYLTKNGFKVDAYVLDANKYYLDKAKSRGLRTILSSIQNSNVKNIDLIIARAFIHYNPKNTQQKLMNKIFSSLKKGGFFVHQMSSGSKENCKLRSDIVNLRSLGRAAPSQKYSWITEKECLKMMKLAGFKENVVAGYAPDNSWSPQEIWERANKKRFDEAKEPRVKILLEKKRIAFLSEANKLIERYVTKYKSKDIKKLDEATYLIKYKYPILIGRKPI